jgi:hypothetical protein
MCIETHNRLLPCTHTLFSHWSYCSVIIPSDRLPETGRSCRRYKLQVKEKRGKECFECLKESAIVSEEEVGGDGDGNRQRERGEGGRRKRKSGVRGWVRRVFGNGC